MVKAVNKNSTLLKLDDVAKRLGCSTCHARRLCETGKLRAKNIGIGKYKVWRVHPSDLDAYAPSAEELKRREDSKNDFIEIG